MRDLLALAVRATAVPADADVLLTRIAMLLADHVDWVFADRLDEPDLVTRVVALSHDGPLELAPELGQPSARRSSAGSIGILPAMLASGAHVLRLRTEELEAVVADGDAHAARQAAGALARGTRDLVVMALVARGVPLGVLTLGSSRPLPEELLEQLPDIASHVATALDAARLLSLQKAVATVMQQHLLPPLPAVPGLSLAARYVPAARGIDVGGDWYDAFRTAAGLVVAIGDVEGHDLAAAARMAELRNLLRAHAVEGDLAPDALLQRLAATASMLGINSTATVTVGRLQQRPDGWLLRWCNAGHPPPLLLAGGVGRWLDPAADLLLGVDDSTVRTSHELLLQAGDTLVLFTDGLVEQRGSDLATRMEELRTAVEMHAGAPDPLAEHLIEQLAGPAADDVALLVLRVDG
ncbi:MAG: PP2C family protein-serine/threonine phosphatase [Mycobacteriales bacterium]